MPSNSRYDVLIVGAGPAGLAAACCAAESGLRIGVVDDNPDAGGQIWRSDRAKPRTPEAAQWFERVRQAKFDFVPGTQIVAQVEPRTLLADSGGEASVFCFEKLIIATGARERFLPFPGWTLPGVMGAGGLQALVKTGLPIAGKSVVVAGSGPLLLAVAAYLREKGADVRLITEQAPGRRLAAFALRLIPGSFSKLRQALSFKKQLRGIPYRTGCWPIAAMGNSTLDHVVFSNGRRTWSEPCNFLACGFGLVPNLELAQLLGCNVKDRAVQVNEHQETTVKDVYCAGEASGIGGLEKSLIEGQIAGYAATRAIEKARSLFSSRKKALRFARLLDQTFALRAELKQLADMETIICRCEDVPYSRLKECTNWREAKLHCRLGMGPCQGRICGGATEFLFDWKVESVRPPVFPTKIAMLGTELLEDRIPS